LHRLLCFHVPFCLPALQIAGRRIVFAGLAALLLAPLPAAAQTSAPGDLSKQAAKKLSPDTAREMYDRHRRELKEVDEQRRLLSRDTGAMDYERAQLNSSLIGQAQKIQEAEGRLTEIEKRAGQLAEKEKHKRVELKGRHAELSRILTILQRLGRQPPPVLVTEREDALTMVRSGMLLGHSFRTVKPLADQLAADLNELNVLEAQLGEERAKQLAAEVELKSSHAAIETALKAKADALKSGQARLDELKHTAAKYASVINTLADASAGLDRVVADKTGLGLYEAELARTAGVELKPDAKKIAFVQPGRMKPAIPFGQAKGMLPLPAQGRKVRNFGAADDFGGTAKGIVIETRSGAQVTAPCDGWVTFAQDLKSYGRVLIINGGGGYHVVLAGMDVIQVNIGQFVLAGEPVATMAAPDEAAQSGAPAQKPALYVEFRKDQRAIDPDPWWSNRVEKG
jgi:septal ring factor EnvC (AmiA/AmiB activator)